MKVKIINITKWEEDDGLIAGDSSREGWREVEQLLEEERANKIDNGHAPGLPFVCEAEDDYDALERYNEECCKHDYLIAVECDWEEVKE